MIKGFLIISFLLKQMKLVLTNFKMLEKAFEKRRIVLKSDFNKTDMYF